MKNTLSYYYGIDVNSIHQKNKKFYFKFEDYEYCFVPCDKENIEYIYNLSNQLIQSGIYCHQIIKNNNQSIITKVNNDDYVLMKIFVETKDIDINDIINFNNLKYVDNNELVYPDWYELWTEKIDYFEYQISQIGKRLPIIRKSFSYYIGLAENAISLIKSIPNKNLNYSLNHKRMCFKDNLKELYNPLNFIIDIRFRDVCEYFKSCFFEKIDIKETIELYLYYNNLTYEEWCYFFARMLFPTYYFDLYEKIINNEIDEIKINNITILADEYEILLKRIYVILKNKINLPNFEWLLN